MPPPKGAWNPIEGPGDYTMTKIVHNDTYPGIDPTKSDYSGKAIFVSGASRGIGRAIAVSYAKAGASYIAISARGDLSTAENEIKAAAKAAGCKEPQVLCLKIDVADEKSVSEGVKQIEKEFGKLDVVICNAGIIHLEKEAELHEQDVGRWWQQMQINLFGTYLITRAVLPLILNSSLKTIISIASVGAHCISPGLSAYQISKLAVVRLMEFVSAEYKDSGVVAISVHPGNVLTDIVGNGEEMDEKLKSVFTESKEICADTCVKLSEEHREWLSGRYVNVTWDMDELLSEGKRKEILEGDLLRVRMAV